MDENGEVDEINNCEKGIAEHRKIWMKYLIVKGEKRVGKSKEGWRGAWKRRRKNGGQE